MTALVPSMILISGAGASDIAAAAFAVRSMPACNLARTSGLKERMVPKSRIVGNDVAGGAAVDRADADDAEFGRILFAADHTLHIDDEARRDPHGIDGRVRCRAVTAAAVECDLEAVGVG